MRRMLLAAALLTTLGGFVVPALAAPPAPPVHVTPDANGGYCVSAFSWVPNCVDPPPVIGRAAVESVPPVYVYRKADGSVCVSYSTVAPFCVPGISPTVPLARPAGLPYVALVNNAYVVGVAVTNSDGSPFVAAVVYKDGSNACIGLSYQAPICLS